MAGPRPRDLIQSKKFRLDVLFMGTRLRQASHLSEQLPKLRTLRIKRGIPARTSLNDRPVASPPQGALTRCTARTSSSQ